LVHEEESVANLRVKFAIYGGLPGGVAGNDKAIDVTSTLQNLIDQNGGIVTINNAAFGDPVVGTFKHFGALVTRPNADGSSEDFYFACKENETIDFNREGGLPVQKSSLTVKFAVYGALQQGNRAGARAVDVTDRLQSLLDLNDAPVVCNNANFTDPSVGDIKSFAAVVDRGGTDFHFACQENQTIDFASGGE
jgi:hypothetical protein